MRRRKALPVPALSQLSLGRFFAPENALELMRWKSGEHIGEWNYGDTRRALFRSVLDSYPIFWRGMRGMWKWQAQHDA